MTRVTCGTFASKCSQLGYRVPEKGEQAETQMDTGTDTQAGREVEIDRDTQRRKGGREGGREGGRKQVTQCSKHARPGVHMQQCSADQSDCDTLPNWGSKLHHVGLFMSAPLCLHCTVQKCALQALLLHLYTLLTLAPLGQMWRAKNTFQRGPLRLLMRQRIATPSTDASWHYTDTVIFSLGCHTPISDPE